LPGKKAHMSALKAVRRDARKTVYRGVVRTSTRTHVKKARTLIATGKGTDPSQAVLEAISALDKAAQKGVIHKNQAARRKSRLMAALNKAKAIAA
jgi:small subunit ribosomal protein S20